MAVARSVTLKEGILEMNVSPALGLGERLHHEPMPSASEIQKRVMRRSVIGSSFVPLLTRLSKNGMTEPRDPATLP